MKLFLTKHAALIAIILVALCVRLYKINNPVLDWHSFRQADTASVTREYVKHGIDILHPRYQDLSNIQSGEENTEGYRMVEFPILNAIVALIVNAVPLLSLEITHRLLSIAFSLGTLTFLFFIVKEVSGIRVAYASALVLAVLPYSVYYSRTILPEPALLFFFVASLSTYIDWIKTKKIHWYLLSVVCMALAFLLKPFVVFFFPVFVVIAIIYKKKAALTSYLLYLFFIISVIPFFLWRQWIAQFPTGIPANHWLLDGITTPFPDNLPRNKVNETLHTLIGYNKDGLRYHPAWVRWLVYERITKLILGFTGIVFLLSALYKLKKKELYILGTWWLCTALYFLIFAKGNVQHDYYQYILLPLIAWTMGRGMIMLEQVLSKKVSHLIAFMIVLVLFLSGLFFSWREVKGYYAVNHPDYVTVGAIVDRVTPPDAKIIAPALGDTMFLYQTNRTGWPIGEDIEEKIRLGATYYVSTSYDDEARTLEKKYFTVEKTPQYILLDLTRNSTDTL